MKNSDLRIVFMGTPDFAVPSLEILIEHGYNIVGVITSTDKYGGRGKKKLLESAVKKCAMKHNLHILQPKNLKNEAFVEELRSLQADLQVVVAFRMLPVVVWDMPPMGTINLHGSLLPRYRGAAPINWAIIRGDKETGLTTFKLKHEIDTGDMIDQVVVPIESEDTAGTLHDKMMVAGAQLLLDTVNDIRDNQVTFKKQDNTGVTKAPKIHHEDCEINFDQSTSDVYNFVRGLSPYPCAWTTLDGQQLNIYDSAIEMANNENLTPGVIETDNKRYLKISCRDGYLILEKVQLQGRKRMDIRSFLNGYEISSSAIG